MRHRLQKTPTPPKPILPPTPVPTGTPTVAPNPGSGPLVILGKKNVVYDNISVSNPSGDCISVTNSNNISFTNSKIGPCKGGVGIKILSSNSILVQNSTIHDTSGEGINAQIVTGLNVNLNQFEVVSSGVYVLNSSQVQVERNQFLNVQGPRPRGGGAQFDKVNGAGNKINCNTITNRPNESSTYDLISLYESNGTTGDPIQVMGNKLIGGGPSTVGGGIMLADGGGSNMLVQYNILVDPGQYGIAVGSGQYVKVLNNTIYGRQQSFTNVGLYVWNQYQAPCGNNLIDGNSVNFTKSDGTQHSYYQGDLSPKYSGYECNNDTWGKQNTSAASITSAIGDQSIDFCK